MKTVKESKRLVALLAVLFLMSGVFSVIASASPEDSAGTEPTQKTYAEEGLQISEAIRVQSAMTRKVLFERDRSETISARVDNRITSASEAVPTEVPAEPEAAPSETYEEPVYEEPEMIAEEAVEPEYVEEYTEEPQEYYSEPEYVPEEYYEPEYVPEEYYEPEYIPEEVYVEPEPPVEEYVPEPQPEYVPEPTPEPTPEPAPEPNLTYLGNFMLTAYCPCPACCGAYATGYTASGTLATEGVTIAMGGLDFGTKVSINGHIYTVEDRGTAYGHVDVFFANHSSALAFGLQYADVYLVG